MELTFVCVIGLPFFFVVPQPIPLFRFADWIKERDNLLQTFFNSIRQSRKTSDSDFSGLIIRDFEKFLHFNLYIDYLC
jgi:hypothetical protein